MNTGRRIPSRLSYDSLEENGAISGWISAEDFSRIPKELTILTEIKVNIRCKRIQGRLFLELYAKSTFGADCQRCLEQMRFTEIISLKGVISQTSTKNLQHREDTVFSCLDGELDVLNLLEDEILLSLPMVPRHDLDDCQFKVSEIIPGDVKRQSGPFSILKDFL